jgi:20S proteasome subunit alpha 4
MGYASAITIFSPDGHLFQVEYAQESVERGSIAVGIKGADCIVLGTEKKSQSSSLMMGRTMSKICFIDSHISLAFAGLTADARILIDRIRSECQHHQMVNEDPVTVEYITRYVANMKQKYTQANGRRPFGLGAMIAGFDPHSHRPHLYATDPAGTYFEWKANAIGHNSKTVKEYLSKNYTENLSDEKAIKLAVEALLEILQVSGKNMELGKSNHFSWLLF